jgi:hypothetical protein
MSFTCAGVPILLSDDDLDMTAAAARQAALNENLRTRTGFLNNNAQFSVPDPLGLQNLLPAAVTPSVRKKNTQVRCFNFDIKIFCILETIFMVYTQQRVFHTVFCSVKN